MAQTQKYVCQPQSGPLIGTVNNQGKNLGGECPVGPDIVVDNHCLVSKLWFAPFSVGRNFSTFCLFLVFHVYCMYTTDLCTCSCIAIVVFTALHICRAVFPITKASVRLSRRELWQNEQKFRQDSYTTWKVIHIRFPTHRMVGGGRPLLPEILGRRGPPSFKNGDFHAIFARSGSTIGASEKSSIMTNRGSVRAFQWA